MADKRISQLNSHTSPSGSDLLVIVNNNETKKITYADLQNSIVFNSDNTLLNDFSASYLLDSASFDTRIFEATNEQDLSGYATTGSNIFTGNQTIEGSLIIGDVNETLFVYDGIGGNMDVNYEDGAIFYLQNLGANGIWNVNNVPTINGRAITITFVVEQGSTPYSGSSYQINEEPISVKWVYGEIPSGSANSTEIIGLTAFRVNSSWNVIGSLSTFQ